MRYTQLLATLLPLFVASVSEAQSPHPPFNLSKIDAPILTEFHKAWHRSGNGMCDVESVILVFSNPDGSYRAQSLKPTNEVRQVTFRWNPETIAVIHTHPNNSNPEPADQDMALANRFGVPIFTITLRGMFMYDPDTKKVSKIKDGLRWLDASSWKQDYVVASNPPTKKTDSRGTQ